MASAASGGSFKLDTVLLAAVNNASKHNVTVDGKAVDYAGMVKSLQTAFSKAYSPCDFNPCTTGHKCVDLKPDRPYTFDFACQSKCKDHSCGVYSECFQDKEGDPSCVYSESKLMLFLGISIGGFLALITLVGMLCLLCRWRKADTRAKKEEREMFSTSPGKSPQTHSAKNAAFVEDESGKQHHGTYASYLGYEQDSLSKALKTPRPNASPEKLGLLDLATSQDQASPSSRTKEINTERSKATL
ncbi:uncharacterized protein LOC135499920 [Lineus longissimus]|uniref:uncharacterized protein LOC135499920 n=1 Tax=Lineus longissimus TaxID=88925 RepID=UPI00315D3209